MEKEGSPMVRFVPHISLFSRSIGLSLIPCLISAFLFLLKRFHSPSLPVVPCVLVALLTCLGRIDFYERIALITNMLVLKIKKNVTRDTQIILDIGDIKQNVLNCYVLSVLLYVNECWKIPQNSRNRNVVRK